MQMVHRNKGDLIMIILAVAEFLFSLYMAFICVKKKVKLWGLWLVFILSIYGGIAFSLEGDIILSCYLRTFGFPHISNNQNTGMWIYLSVPIGAIIFFMKNKAKNAEYLHNDGGDDLGS